MKHCCHRLVLAFLSALLVLPSALRADIIIMKNGTKYADAKILSETPETVTFEYVVVAKIKDNRTESRKDIAEIIKQKPEETEIVALRKLLPTADLLTADKYESLIQDQVRPFVTKYAGTPQATEAEGIIKTLQDEKEKVAGGAVKMEGQWISSDMAKRDAHSIDAYRVRRDMKEIAADTKLPPEERDRHALIEWQKMSDPTDGYTDTLQYVKTIPEVLVILADYKKTLDRMILEQPQLLKRRTDSLSKMLPNDPILARTKRAIDAELLAFTTEIAVEKKSRVRWMSVYKYDLKSLQAANKIVIDEMARLRLQDVNKLTTQNEALVAATRYLADGNVEQTEAALQRATAVNGLSLSNKAIQTLRTRLAALKTEQNIKRRAKTVYGTGNVNAITNGTATATDSRVTDALAAQEKAKADKKEGKEDAKPASTEKAPLTNADATDAEPAPAGKSDAASTSATTTTHRKDKPKKSHTTSSPAALATTPVPEEGGIQTKMVMAGGGLLAVLLTVMFLQKRKSKAA